MALLVTTTCLGVLGAVEDLRGVRARARLGAQVAIACIVTWLLQPLADPASSWWLLGVVTMSFWIVAFVNAFNFMDGINGISAAQTIIAGGGFAAMGMLTENDPLTAAGGVVAAAAMGFAPFNFPRAWVFLGDAGSYFLGGWLALLPILALLYGVPAHAVASPFLIYLSDTGTTLVKRVIRREPWRQPHRTHVYQRLTQLGWSHARTTTAISSAVLACTVLGIATIDTSAASVVVASVAMGAVVVLYLAAPAVLGHRLPQAVGR